MTIANMLLLSLKASKTTTRMIILWMMRSWKLCVKTHFRHEDDHENLQQNQDCSTVEDEEILHLDSQQELHEMDQQSEGNLYTPPLEINEDNHCLSKREQKLLSPLFEDEIDQLLHDHVTVQVGIDLQYAHGQEGDGGTYSFAEKDDSLENSFIH